MNCIKCDKEIAYDAVMQMCDDCMNKHVDDLDEKLDDLDEKLDDLNHQLEQRNLLNNED